MIKYQVENSFGISFSDVRKKFPTVSLVEGESNKELKIIAYQTSPQPAYDHLTQQVFEVAPKEHHGVYRQSWLVVPLPKNESELRIKNHKESVKRQVEQQLYELFDIEARKKGYDSYHNVLVRAGFKSKYQKECTAFAKWMEECESIYFECCDSVEKIEELQDRLPVPKW